MDKNDKFTLNWPDIKEFDKIYHEQGLKALQKFNEEWINSEPNMPDDLKKILLKNFNKINVDHWTITVNFNLSYFGLDDHEEKTGLYVQKDESSCLFIQKIEELGFTEEFLYWFYEWDFGNVMNESDYQITK